MLDSPVYFTANMISQFFILTPRGDTIVSKDYRGDVARGTSDIFFRKLKTFANEPPPIFVRGGRKRTTADKAVEILPEEFINHDDDDDGPVSDSSSPLSLSALWPL